MKTYCITTIASLKKKKKATVLRVNTKHTLTMCYKTTLNYTHTLKQ